MKGTNDDDYQDAKALASALKGTNDDDSESDEENLAADLEIQSFSRESSFKRRSVLIQGLEHVTDGSLDFSSENLAALIRGGKDSPDENK